MQNAKKIHGAPNDLTLLKEEILKSIDRMDMERVKMLYITAKIWENKPE